MVSRGAGQGELLVIFCLNMRFAYCAAALPHVRPKTQDVVLVVSPNQHVVPFIPVIPTLNMVWLMLFRDIVAEIGVAKTHDD